MSAITFDPPITLTNGGKVYVVACEPLFVLVVRYYGR